MTDPQRFERALFIRFGGLGDILLATPSVRALQAAFPGIVIDFIVGGGMRDALSGHSCVRNVLTFDKRGVDSRLDHFVPFLWRVAQARYDLVVNLHPSAKSYLMAAASGARTRLTFRKRMAVDPTTGRVTHAVDDFYKELTPLGVGPLTDRSLDFIIPEAARVQAAQVLSEFGVSGSEKLLVVNPAASRPLNRWPLERFPRGRRALGRAAGRQSRRDRSAVLVQDSDGRLRRNEPCPRSRFGGPAHRQPGRAFVGQRVWRGLSAGRHAADL